MSARLGRYPTRFDDRGPTATVAPPLERLLEEIDVLERLDRDWSVECEYQPNGEAGPICGAPGAWWVICRRCGHAIAECAPHRAREDERMNSFAGLFLTVHCRRCEAPVHAPFWRDLFIVEPIGRRS